MDIEVQSPTAKRAQEIESEFERLGRVHLELDGPSLVERAGRLDYADVKVQKARQDRDDARRQIELRATKLLEEHARLCTEDASLQPLSPLDSLQLMELRRRLRSAKLTLGRTRVLASLPASRTILTLRRRKRDELEQEVDRLEGLVRRIEGLGKEGA